jgi:hypothetical protein
VVFGYGPRVLGELNALVVNWQLLGRMARVVRSPNWSG